MQYRYLVLLLLSPLTLAGQSIDNYLGGGLSLSIIETGQNQPNQSFSNSDASQFNLSFKPYWYREKTNSGFGAGLYLSYRSNKRTSNAETISSNTATIGGKVFWRFLVAKPSSNWRIFLSPSSGLSYSVQSDANNRRPTNRSYVASLDFGPSATWNLNKRFRLVFDYRLFDYRYTYIKIDDSQGFNYNHAFNLKLTPDNFTLGIEFGL